MQVNPPASVLSATNLSILLVLLVITSAATFWFSAERYAKEQLQEIEDLRLEAEAREVCFRVSVALPTSVAQPLLPILGRICMTIDGSAVRADI